MSADIPDFSAVRRDLRGLTPGFSNGTRGTAAMNHRVARLGLSPRQMELNRLWAHFCACHYDAFKTDWDGQPVDDPIEFEAVVSGSTQPRGFYDYVSSPIKYRKPCAPYNISRAVVLRFSGLLFSTMQHPAITVDGDSATEDYAQALAKAGRLWPKMYQARNYGGATGTVAVGFQYVDGRPVIEVHDPRWTTPVFEDRHELKLKAVEKLYQFPKELWNPEKNIWEEVPHWYRRVITDQTDIVYKEVPVNPESPNMPLWEPLRQVDHRFGFCPVVWIQNLPVDGDIDGESDCHGLLGLARQIDELRSEAAKGVKANCDPTLFIATKQKLGDLRKGSDNAIKLEEGTAEYLEISGAGPEAAVKLANQFKDDFLEQAQCVLDPPDESSKTATEVIKRYKAMHEKAEVLREQYGENGVKPLMTMMVAAARKLTAANGAMTPDGKKLMVVVKLPPRVERDENGGQVSRTRKLGEDANAYLDLNWPPYMEPTIQDAQLAVAASAGAKAAGLIDQDHAVRKVAPFFQVKDVPAMVKKIEDEQKAQAADMAQQMGLGDTSGWGNAKPLGERMPKTPAPGGG